MSYNRKQKRHQVERARVALESVGCSTATAYLVANRLTINIAWLLANEVSFHQQHPGAFLQRAPESEGDR